MWSIFTKCIFCDQDLPESLSGMGEHVIPSNLFGFWCSHDVCSNCIEYFGYEIDKLGINNPDLIHSMEKLKIQKLEKRYEQIPFIAKDVINATKIEMIRRKGTFKAKTRREGNNYLECSESNFDFVAKPFIRSLIQGDLSSHIVEKEIDDLKEKYLQLKFGESVFSELLKITLKRNQVNDVKYDFDKVPSITPLISKIVFIAIHYFVPLDIVGSIFNYWDFRDHARYNKSLNPDTINICILQKKDIRFPFHAIRFSGGGHTLMVDCMLFGYNNWRCLFHCDKEVSLIDGNGKQVDKIAYYMDFQDIHNRQKYLEFTYPNKSNEIYSFSI